MASTFKISRPVLYTIVGSIAAYAIFLYTQPDAPTAKHTSRYATRSHAVDPDAISPEDLHAHFPRYQGGKRDPFVPQVLAKKPPAPVADTKTAKSSAGWALTGINVVNGVASALIENSASNNDVFLQPGDHWNGLRVVSVDSDKVVFMNALGQKTQLTFAVPPPDASEPTGKPGTSVPPLPAFSAIRPLPPLSPASVNGATQPASNAVAGASQ